MFSKIEKNYPLNPFGKKVLASREEYIELFNNIKNKNYPEIDKYEENRNYKLEKKWLDKLALQTQITIKKSPLNYQHGRILYSCLRKYLEDKQQDNRIINIIETGTSRGFSSICMSKALIDSNQIGNIFTFDILPHNKKMIWNSISDNDSLQSRREFLQPLNKELKNIIFIQGFSRNFLNRIFLDRCHFAFLDAEHTYKEVMNEFNYIKNIQLSGDIVVFDDVSPKKFDGVVNALNFIENEKSYKVIKIISSDNRGYAIATKI